MEIQTGNERDPEKKSKTEVLFVSAPPSSYKDPGTHDNVDLGVIPLGGGRFFPVVSQFCYLGCLLTTVYFFQIVSIYLFKKSLRRANIERNKWTALASDRDVWRKMISI